MREIYETKLRNINRIDEFEANLHNALPSGTEIVNNHNNSILVKTDQVDTSVPFAPYDFFNKAIYNEQEAEHPELLYNILTLGNNTFLLQF